MRIHICAVGSLRSRPEEAMIQAYVERFARIGASLGLGPLRIHEVDAKGKGISAETRLLSRAIPKGAWVCALDERGKTHSSPAFAQMLVKTRESRNRDCVFLIGGADGLPRQVVSGADTVLSLGAMVWPHAMARVMLVEQIYRAATILTGHPYHRQ